MVGSRTVGGHTPVEVFSQLRRIPLIPGLNGQLHLFIRASSYVLRGRMHIQIPLYSMMSQQLSLLNIRWVLSRVEVVGRRAAQSSCSFRGKILRASKDASCGLIRSEDDRLTEPRPAFG